MNVNEIVVSGFGMMNSEIPKDLTSILKNKKAAKVVTRTAHLAEIAAHRALIDAKLIASNKDKDNKYFYNYNPFEMGLYMGVGPVPSAFDPAIPLVTHSLNPENNTFDLKRFATEGITRTNPLLVLHYLSGLVLSHVAISFNIKGSTVIFNSFAAGAVAALQSAVLDLLEDNVKYALVGGADELISYMGTTTYFNWGWFDHKDFVQSEGAGFLILEKKENANKRLARSDYKAELLSINLSTKMSNECFNKHSNDQVKPLNYFPYVTGNQYGAAGPILEIIDLINVNNSSEKDNQTFCVTVNSPNGMNGEIILKHEK
ncbi:MAG: hypothetical protein HQK51_02485 [Oligoflexia bacterium]|nr:hypothetical protein [Oligoflexia bacterium]